MQSFLQYRRIRRQLEQQLDRHNGKREEGSSSSDSPSPAAEQDGGSRDVEKDAGRNSTQGNGPIHKEGDEENNRLNPSSSRESVESVDPSKDETPGDQAAGTADQPTEGLKPAPTRASSTRSLRSFGTRLGHSLTGINARDRTTKEGGNRDEEVFVVGFENEEDMTNPHNWSNARRITVTLLVANIGIVVGVASSIDSSILMNASQDFGVSQVTESLATGLYLVGFGAGSLFVAPFSETFGRNPVYVSTLILFAVWVMASGLAPNIGAQLAFRFLAGLFGSTPLTCAGGSIADMWNPLERTLSFPVFANAAFTGPVLGPIIGGWISQSARDGIISWRWTEWVTLIWTGLVIFAVVGFMPETYSAILLHWKAKHLRDLTGDQRYKSSNEVTSESFIQKMKRSISRPFVMTSQEPIIIFISLYLTVIYIILFTFLDGYDYIFTEIHGTSPGITGTCFVGILVGLFIASALVWPVWKLTKRDLDRALAAGKDRLPPESRLWTAMLGGSLAIPISLFWMAWTSYPDISIWSPLIASALFGFGILAVFITSYQYIIDSYEVYSASALAFVTLIRYVAAGGMVVVGIPFYENLGVHYTLTILACISAAVAPLPYLFWIYGPAIRKRSKYAIGSGE